MMGNDTVANWGWCGVSPLGVFVMDAINTDWFYVGFTLVFFIVSYGLVRLGERCI
jgi:hypothetical protein